LRGSIAMLMAAAAKSDRPDELGQVSPTRKLSDFQKNNRTGRSRGRQQDGHRVAPAISPATPSAPRPDKTTGSRMNRTSPNCSPT